MKVRMLAAISILIFTVLIISASCATEKQAYIAKSDEELFGTWANPDYGVDHSQKFIFYDWGYLEKYKKVKDQHPNRRGTFFLIDKWTDSEGSIWYRTHMRYRGSTDIRFYFMKIDKRERVLETVWSYNDFPSLVVNKTERVQEDVWSYSDFPSWIQLDTKDANYRIYYRQE